MGKATGITPFQQVQLTPPVPPHRLAHLVLGLLGLARHHPFAQDGRTCIAPYLSHEVLLKCLLLEGLRPQAVCKEAQGSVWEDGQTSHPSFPFPCPWGERGQENTSSTLYPEPAGELSRPFGLRTYHPS